MTWAGSMAQVVEYLPRRHKALCSNPSTNQPTSKGLKLISQVDVKELLVPWQPGLSWFLQHSEGDVLLDIRVLSEYHFPKSSQA
jgi:hypothetical protein